MRHPDQPYRPGGTNTARTRKEQAERSTEAVERARRRYVVVREAIHEMRENGYTKREAWSVLRTRSADPADEFSEKVPAQSTFYGWLKTAEKADELSIQVFRDRERPGRPRKPIPQDVEDFIVRRLRGGFHRSHSSLFRKVSEEFGDRAPSEHVFNRFIQSLDPSIVSAGQHGSRAAQADTMPKRTIPVDYPHQYWALDEATLPLFIKAWNPREKRLASVKPQFGAIVDAYSRACLSLHLFRPYRLGTAGGYGGDDILATFLSAALPEVAAPPCVEFTGFLPTELRMDHHKTHNDLWETLREDGGVTVANLRVANAWANGLVEAFIDTFKEMCEDLRGAEHKYVPADRVNEDPRATRTKASGYTSERAPRRIPVAVEDLLSYEELVDELHAIARRYNNREHDGLGGRTPRDVYHSSLRTTKELRPGHDAVLFLKARTVKMDQHLRVLGERFAPEANGRELTMGERLVVRVDPLRRGLWLEEGGSQHWVPTLNEYAKEVQPGDVARQERKKARGLSDEAQEDVEETIEQEVGPGAIERGRYAAGLAGNSGRKADHEPSRSEEPVAEEPVPGEPDVEEPSTDHEGNGTKKRVRKVKPVGLASFGNRIKKRQGS